MMKVHSASFYLIKMVGSPDTGNKCLLSICSVFAKNVMYEKISFNEGDTDFYNKKKCNDFNSSI